MCLVRHAARNALRMRITEMVNQIMQADLINSYIGGGGDQGVQGINASGDGSYSPKAKLAIPAANTPQSNAPTDSSTPSQGDVVDLSAYGLTGSGQPQQGGSAGDAPVQSSSDVFGGLVEKFIHKRALMAYHVPGPNGTSLDFVFEVETAYRTIEPLQLQSGQQVDTQA